tara:strand:+ start:2198 stop:5353 length:3156 start_codon:yes stop_codon:yes gene_type:complete
MSNTDVRGGQANDFPVSPPGETTPTYSEQLSDVMEKAVQHFETLSEQTSFDPGTGQQPDGTYGSGHSLLQERAPEMVTEEINTMNTVANSRWYGIKQQRFAPNTGESNSADLYQVQKTGECLDTSEQDRGITKFTSYSHPSGLANNDSARGDFWTDYFDRLKLVGPKITLGATGHDLPKSRLLGGKDPGSAPMGILKQGLVTNDDLRGNYAKHDVKLTEAGETFKNEDGSNVYDRYDTLSSEFKFEEIKQMSTETYGQMNSWHNPFETTGFPIIENQGLRVSIQLLEIWAMVVLRLLITTSLLQIASYLISWKDTEIAKKAGIGNIGGKHIIPWNRNYYSEAPQTQSPTEWFKGSSGFNHPASDLITASLDSFNRDNASKKNAPLELGAMQLAGPALNSAGKILEEEYLNITVAIQRELNIYIPRHILSTMANETTNYHGNPVVKSIDIFTAYVRAYTAGMATLVTHIVAGDMGKSLGFWKTVFRTVVRSKAHWRTYVKADSAYDKMLHFVGKDDKIMQFANYLAMIGDLGTAAGHAGNIAFPENKVPLDQVSNFPTLRTIGRKRGTNKSRLSLTETPSLLLIPNNVAQVRHNLGVYGVEEGSSYGSIEGSNPIWYKKEKDDPEQEIGNKYQPNDNNRFSPDQVRMIEDQLEGEHMPFYIHDLRTNEIISFHAFLTSLSDSYTGEWSAQKGFGRLEAAQIYGGGSRSIGLSFSIIAMNEEDFDEMYYKINKLTTLVYPQWSEGTLMDSGDSTFIQPFSQVPTASPLCRIRVGDLFTSNYSKVAMARMMGIGNKKFVYTEPGAKTANPEEIEEWNNMTLQEKLDGPRFIKPITFAKLMQSRGDWDLYADVMLPLYKNDPTIFRTEWKNESFFGVGDIGWGELSALGLITTPINFEAPDADTYLSKTEFIAESGRMGPSLAGLFGGGPEPVGISSLFNVETNPILKSFNSTMGRGIAVAITGITFDWKLNSAPWELRAGSRAPRMCDVQLSLVPIHDITPGLDHQGINRAPIYKVGSKSKSLTGDAWYNKSDYQDLVGEVEKQHQLNLRGEEE